MSQEDSVAGRRPEQTILSLILFPFSSQSELWFFPCPRTSTQVWVRCGAIFERVCSRSQSSTENMRLAGAVEQGRVSPPRLLCSGLIKRMRFLLSRFLDKGMGTREWSNLRLIRSRFIPFMIRFFLTFDLRSRRCSRTNAPCLTVPPGLSWCIAPPWFRSFLAPPGATVCRPSGTPKRCDSQCLNNQKLNLNTL